MLVSEHYLEQRRWSTVLIGQGMLLPASGAAWTMSDIIFVSPCVGGSKALLGLHIV